MPHLLHVWPAVSRRIREASRTLLAFDFDGTLTPIVDLPDHAALAPEVRATLESLSRQDRYLTGIVSGRSLADILARVDVPGLFYAGNHGLEMTGPGLDFVHPGAEKLRDTQTELYHQLRSNLSDLPGVLVENKGLTLSVHYRMAAERAAEVEARFNRTVSPFRSPGRSADHQGQDGAGGAAGPLLGQGRGDSPVMGGISRHFVDNLLW